MDDVKKYPNLIRSKSSGMLSFRRTVPKELRSVIGKSEVKHAFGTDALEEVLETYIQIRDETDAMFKAARRKRARDDVDTASSKFAVSSTDSSRNVGDDDRAVVHTHYEVCRAEEHQYREAIRSSVLSDPALFWRGRLIPLPPGCFVFGHRIVHPIEGASLRLKIPTKDLAYWLSQAFAKRVTNHADELNALLIIGDVAGVREHCRQAEDISDEDLMVCAQTRLRFYQDLLQNPALLHETLLEANAIVGAVLPTLTVQGHSWKKDRSGCGEILSIAAERWLDENATRWNVERQKLCKVVLGDYIQVCGDRPVDTYGKHDANDFKCPASAPV